LKPSGRPSGKAAPPAGGAGGDKGGIVLSPGAASSLLGGWSAVGVGKPRKRSLTIAGHRTAVSLEEPFWEALRLAAGDLSVPIARLVAEIDAVRGQTSLSSAIRLFVLDYRSRR
jgi:predicted DNA-binding ribbon-helix-helix protein